MKRFNLPDVGEGLQEAEIVQWLINVGDKVAVDQIILIIETDKANVEIPSPYQGIISKLHGKPGDIVKVGDSLVEYAEESDSNQTADSGTVVGTIESGTEILRESPTGIRVAGPVKTGVKATPAVRALATQLGVDLSTVAATGPKGTITKADVTKAAETPAITQSSAGEYQPLKRAKRSMALNMSKSHSQVALVTLMDDANISRWPLNEDLTSRLVLAIVAACQAEPALNVHYDHDALAVHSFSEVHLGIAVDTPDGLYVPVMRNAERLDTTQIRQTINRFKAKAREKSFQQEELKGATLILSNFGGIGGRYATPMVVPPMVAIIGVGRTQEALKWVAEQPHPTKKLPLSLSFDHRAVTGGEAARFLTAMIKNLQQ